MALSSWSCEGCTNICYRYINGEIRKYCKEFGSSRTEWQGDYVACLDYTTDPNALDPEVRIHECMLPNKGEENV